MALRGDLASVDLAQVFQMLALNKKVGLLSIQSPRLWKVLYFDPRGVTLYYNPHTLLDRAVATFVRVGRIQAGAVEEMREHASRNDLGLLDTLLAGGYLSEEELTAQMRYEVEEEVYELFFCKDARFEFLEGVDKIDEREGVVDERFFFNTESVIMEAARRIDEWAYIAERISNGLEVFCRTGHTPDVDDVGEECAIVYDCVDGRRNVARIVETSGLSSFAVFKNLSVLLDGGFVEALPASELIAIGQECASEGRPQDAINLFEKAIELGVGVPEVHSMAAEAYQNADEFENAIYHLKCDAEYRVAAGDAKGAAARLRAAAQMVPTDLAARERLVEIVLAHTEVRLPDFDAVAEGKQVVELLLNAGDVRRVRSILERLLAVRPDDLDLKKILVSVHTKAGDHARVIALYESIANTLVKQNRPIEAIGYLQKILMLDRSRTDISDRVRSLYAQDERSRSRRRAMATLGAVCLLLVGLAVAYSFYDEAASEAFEEVSIEDLLAANEFDLAAAELEGFLAQWPLATVGSEVREELSRVDALRLKYEAAQLNRTAARDREVERLRAEYRRVWRQHRDLFLSGRPEAALDAIERVRRLLRDTGEEEDLAWSLEQQVETTYRKIHDFVQTSVDLERQLAEELAAGRVRNAWALAVRLVTEYDITQAGRRTQVPVLVESRPQGAQILLDGEPLTAGADGEPRPLVTPAVVLCRRQPARYRLVAEGFEPADVEIDPVVAPTLSVPLEVIPERRIQYDDSVMTPIASDGRWVVAGLRNGRLGIASAESGRVRHEVELGGLKEVLGRPVVDGEHVWFATNERTLECYALLSGRPVAGWPIALAALPTTPIVARNGRLLFVDEDRVLRCHDQAYGRELWTRTLDSAPAGPPNIARRSVRIGTRSGDLLRLDVTDGRQLDLLRAPSPISTETFRIGDLTVFGSDDGVVRAVTDDGRIRWAVEPGRVPQPHELLADRTAVFVLGDQDQLLRLEGATGRELDRVAAAGELLSLQLTSDRLLVTTRVAPSDDKGQRDRLTAYGLSDLAVRWEYEDEAAFTGPPSVDGRFVAIAGADGDVVLLR